MFRAHWVLSFAIFLLYHVLNQKANHRRFPDRSEISEISALQNNIKKNKEVMKNAAAQNEQVPDRVHETRLFRIIKYNADGIE